MKQTKWLVNLSACLVLMAVSAVGAKENWRARAGRGNRGPRYDPAPFPHLFDREGGRFDPVTLFVTALLCRTGFAQGGEGYRIDDRHLGDSHIQAGYYSGKVMRLLQAQFGNAGRGWIAPFKLSRTNEPDDYFISSSVREWVTGRCIQTNKKCPVGIGGIGIQSVSPSINLDVRIAPNNGAGYSFNQAILYRGEKAMPMLPAGPLKDSVQTSWRTFRLSQVSWPIPSAFLIRLIRCSCIVPGGNKVRISCFRSPPSRIFITVSA